LFTIVPDPGKNLHASREIRRDSEVEVLTFWAIAIVAVGTVALVGCHDVEGLTAVG
jgi:hypothetical protein